MNSQTFRRAIAILATTVFAIGIDKGWFKDFPDALLVTAIAVVIEMQLLIYLTAPIARKLGISPKPGGMILLFIAWDLVLFASFYTRDDIRVRTRPFNETDLLVSMTAPKTVPSPRVHTPSKARPQMPSPEISPNDPFPYLSNSRLAAQISAEISECSDSYAQENQQIQLNPDLRNVSILRFFDQFKECCWADILNFHLAASERLGPVVKTGRGEEAMQAIERYYQQRNMSNREIAFSLFERLIEYMKRWAEKLKSSD